MPFTIPGIGYAGLGQTTAAAQMVYRKASGSGRAAGTRTRRTPTMGSRGGATRRRIDRRGRAGVRNTLARRAAGRGRGRRKAHLVKGSAAARRHMAKLRRMRKR